MAKNKELSSEKVESELNRYKAKVSEESLAKAEKTAVKFKNDKRISHLWNKILVMFEIAKHPKIWGLSVALWAGAALIYLVSPLDIIPDLLPALGLVDDISVITFTLKKITESIKGKLVKNPSLLNEFPEKLRPVAVEWLGIYPVSEKPTDTVETKKEEEKKKVRNFTILYNVILGASKAAGKLGSIKEKEKLKGKPDSLKARIAGWLLEKMENTANWLVETKLSDSIQTSVDLAVEMKTTKGLLSFILFSLSLATYGLTMYGKAWAYVSSVFMVLSYSFIIVALVKTMINSVVFIVGGFKAKQYPFFTFLNGAVAAVVRRVFGVDELFTKKVMDELKSNKTARSMVLRIIHRMFNGEIMRGVIRFLLLCLAFFLMKVITIQLSYDVSPMRILFGPIMQIIG